MLESEAQVSALNLESDSACYYRESIMGIVEVKTTLTNQDLGDVAASASLLAPLPILLFAFHSQSTLKAIDCGSLPDNVLGIYTLSHGSIVRVTGGTCWRPVQPFEQAACGVLRVYSRPSQRLRTTTTTPARRQCLAEAVVGWRTGRV